jgi:hypothetical protein
MDCWQLIVLQCGLDASTLAATAPQKVRDAFEHVVWSGFHTLSTEAIPTLCVYFVLQSAKACASSAQCCRLSYGHHLEGTTATSCYGCCSQTTALFFCGLLCWFDRRCISWGLPCTI